MKKKIAREFIYLIIPSTLFIIFYFSYYFLQLRSITYSENISSRIEAIKDTLPKKQLLWIKYVESGYYTDSYKKFDLEFNYENSYLVFKQLRNIEPNNKFFNSFDDFRLKYFRKESAQNDAYQLYISKVEFITRDSFSLVLENPNDLNRLYKNYVYTGYKGTFIDFKNLIFDGEKILSESEFLREYDRIIVLEKELNENNSSIFQNNLPFESIALIIFLILFPLRYLLYGINWSLKQVIK